MQHCLIRQYVYCRTALGSKSKEGGAGLDLTYIVDLSFVKRALAWILTTRIPRIVCVGGSFLWFGHGYHNRAMAYRTFFCIQGVVGFITTAIFILYVHPKDELLDKDFQCTRHWYYGPEGRPHTGTYYVFVVFG